MKKFIFAILVLIGITCSVSCEKNFDPMIYGTLSTTNFPSTLGDYESELMVCYLPFAIKWTYALSNQMHYFYVPEGSHWRMWDTSSDYCAPVIHGWGGSWRRLTECYFTDLETVGRWSNGTPCHYENIRDVTRMTVIINEIANADPNVLSEAKKKQFLGEARLCRGLVMYYLLHIYGPVPFILDPEKVGNEEEEAKLVRPSLDEITQWITDDFEFAVANCPETQSEVGRYTADYARFCLMKHCLNEGAHMSGYYKKAYDLYSQFTGSYSLFTKGDNPYVEMFREANDFNCETIMAVSCSKDYTGADGEGNFNPWYFYAAPADGARTDDKGNTTVFGLTNQTSWAACFNVDPEYYDTYEEGDLRRDVIITEYYSKKGRWVRRENIGDLWDGFFINKYPFETMTAYQGNDVPLARWADVMLMYAEASVRNSNSVTSEAVEMVNQVRARAGLGALKASDTASVDAFLTKLLEERGHEFLYEGFRKIDLIRFNKFYTTMDKLGRTPTSQYWPIPNFSVNQAKDSGYELTQYFFRDDYDGPKQAIK